MTHYDLTDDTPSVLDVNEVRVVYRNGLCALEHASFSLPAKTITAWWVPMAAANPPCLKRSWGL
ncbi:hypothetical protein [Salinivibrio costicola]|uniref:hypothetical protein n=1 Tax=Salinivibrio costicola TaxID=51367 RepID=UPI003CC551A0